MNTKNAISAVLLALIAILLILILNAPLAQSVTGMLPAITPTTSRLVLIGNLAGVPVHAAVQDHNAYLLDEARRITVVDIQTPTMPFTVGVGSYPEDARIISRRRGNHLPCKGSRSPGQARDLPYSPPILRRMMA